ncbi:hypothetical protein IU433_03285 [Nocardia puris]|uniref:Uncharacterized protein n=1 Tax=Nocardia puris TaxID=208602 RepID=A0A366DVV7_9NOCA|nr:hypothetical protein [Nocardia puris]MBF6210023.1 hypothetical protein [Nocardia puris]MBF6368214.1 hypothetical protein [Nocardia puris]MBF6458067.1 hypothetical protein [Nocardia puris]RBO94230.1 hypothetical protein DFR74_102653 [Nocardia puris]
MTTIPTRDDADHADQQTVVHAADRDIGWDDGALPPLTERVRAGFDAADLTDRLDQALITPLPDDDYPLAY